MLTPKKTELICSQCKKPIRGAKTVINEQWFCGDCTYLHDHPDAVVTEPVRRSRTRPQEETLFVPPNARKR